MSRIFLRALLGALAVTSLTACGPSQPGTSGPVTAVSGTVTIGGPFSLIDHNGKAVTEADFLGKPQLIFFGFAFCPDVCPTALQQMGAALELAGAAADYYQPIFITIDAERDTPEKLALYVTANGFPKNLVGLTGSVAQIEAAKKTFAVYGKKAEDPSSAAGFTYDHTSMIYMMDEKGEFLDVFPHSATPRQIADRLVSYKKTGK